MKRNHLSKWMAYSGVFLGGTALTLGASALVAIHVVVGKFTHPPRYPVNRSDLEKLGLSGKKVFFDNPRDKIRLQGTLFQANANEKSQYIIICSPGYSGHEFSNPSVLPLVKELNARGIDVMTMNFRNQGESGDGITGIGIKEKGDLHAAIFEAERRGYPRVGLMGGSQSGATSLVVAAENPLVGAVAIETSFTDLGEYIKNDFHRWLKLVVPELAMKWLTMGEGENQKLRPVFTSSMLGIARLYGLNPKEVVPQLAARSLAEEGVPTFIAWHDRDSLIPSRYTQTLVKQFIDHDGEVETMKMTADVSPNARDIASTYHLVGYEVHGQAFINNIANFMVSRLSIEKQRLAQWEQHPEQSNWRERIVRSADQKEAFVKFRSKVPRMGPIWVPRSSIPMQRENG